MEFGKFAPPPTGRFRTDASRWTHLTPAETGSQMGDKTGGETSATNTAPLRVRNHQGKTRKQWKYHRNNNGSYQWENTRTGHTYRSHL
ncbi:MAG: hypothetical protein JWM76_3299, partial [Pseudonocardiales bacterium]|nr:hypothetical protein [Pseudonocardiales bacterium]